MAENVHFKLDVKVTQGDTRSIPLEFFDANGDQLDVDGVSFFYTAKKSIKDTDANAAIVIEPALIVPTANPTVKNKITITLTAVNTNLPPGDYHHDIQQVDGNGTLTVAKGTLTIEEQVTQRTAPLT